MILDLRGDLECNLLVRTVRRHHPRKKQHAPYRARTDETMDSGAALNLAWPGPFGPRARPSVLTLARPKKLRFFLADDFGF